MAAYLDGQHHPRQALAPRTAFVALDGDAVIGYAAAHATTRHGCAGEVQYLYVSPEYRRRGIARGLLGCLTRWFHSENIRRVCVDVVDSAAARGFYTASGAVPLNEYWYVWEDIGILLAPEAL